MNDDELERRLSGLFAEVTPPEGMHRWEVSESVPEAGPGRGRGVRLPGLRRPDGRWGPLALAVGLSVAVGVVGAALGGMRLSHGGGQAGNTAAPSGRLGAAMAYDPSTHVTVLFGGLDSTGKALGDTWTWDGSVWRELHPATSPPVRSEAAMGWDSSSARLVLAGGTGAPSPALDDTWTFDGSQWRQEHPAHPAGTFVRASMASRPGGGVVLSGDSPVAIASGVLAPCLPPAGQSSVAAGSCGDTSVPAARALLWDGHDWSDLPSIPGFDPRLVTWGDTVLAVTAGPIGRPLPAQAPIAASPSCTPVEVTTIPLPASPGSVPPAGAPGNLPPVAPFESRSPVATSAAATAGGAAGTTWSCVGAGVPPSAFVKPAAPILLSLGKDSWVKKPVTGDGPKGLTALASDGAQLLAIDVTGATWTSDGTSWHDAGSSPVDFGGGAALAVDADRHVAVLVGGIPTSAVPAWEWDGSTWHLRAGSIPPVPTPPGKPEILPAPASAPPAPAAP